MDHSTSDCQLNPGEVDYEFEFNEFFEPEYLQFMALKPLSVVDDELVPKVGMTFTTLEDAGKFYRNYAKAAGFSTRVRCTNRKGNEIKNQLITCSREGKWRSKISPTEKTNLTAGLNCPARIYIHTLKDVGAWIISKVVLDHSHPCCPSKAEMLKQHRELSMSIRRTIENNEEAGIRPSKTYQSFVAAAGGHRELNFIEKDVRNYITREVRNVSEQEDAKEFGKYFVRMKEKNPNFFFELELEEDQSIKLAFWADARSRAAFEYFGDVISFDTTYNTNSICWGVPNNFAFWTMKIPSKLNGYKGHADIEQEMSHVVWNSHSKDSFDRNWNDFLLNFGLADNKWLSDLYEDRHIWVPIYLDHHFWAGMRSTQRSESMHSFFNKYITRNSSLIQFVKQYDNCLGSREQAERESDAADFHMVIPCATKSSIEAQFQDAYTHAKFREVQAQFRGKATCITRLKNSALGYSIYEVGEQVSSSIFNKFVVTYDSVVAEVKCQCLLFKSRGILCRHALSVLSFEQVSQVSPKYILERWSKKVKRRHTHIKSSHDEPLMEPRSKRFDQLVFRSQNICEFASESEELTAILHRAYDNVMAEMEALKAKRKGRSSLSHEDANLESVNELQSPPRIRTRGRPKNRLGSKLEKQIANATKKKKTKVLSELQGNINVFDAASVAHSNSNQYQGHVMNYQLRVPAAGDNSLGV
ncbi:Protein FAR1-RELATED SEQUENCE [Arachis hypogaea]|nr:Protein FAR1-RELATED SEQUENCE [Arachis hypogaea]